MFDNLQLFTQALGLQEPWKVNKIQFDPDKGQLDLYISFKSGSQFTCPECHELCSIHDTRTRAWRHLNFFQYCAYIHCDMPRIKCDKHGVKQIEAPWARPGSGFTLLFEALIMELAAAMPIKVIARMVNENDTRLWRIVDHYVTDARQKETYRDIEKIGVDETSSKRGHNYVTLFVDLDKKRVVYATEGKDAATIKSFTNDLKAHQGQPENIKDVSCDMSPAFIKGVHEHLPEASITFDKFHVIKQMNEAVDKVRRMEQATNEHLKKSRYVWLKNPDNLTKKQEKSLYSLSKMNLKTMRAYKIKLSLQAFFEITDPQVANAYLKKWYYWATHSRLEAIKEMAYLVKNHWDGIMNYINTRITNGILEGINSLVQATKRKARGYRNINNLINIIYLTCGKLSFELPKAFSQVKSI